MKKRKKTKEQTQAAPTKFKAGSIADQNKIYIDRPPPIVEPILPLVNGAAFRKDYRRLVVQHLKANKVKKKDLTWALFELQNETSLFIQPMLDKIKAKMGFE